MVALIGRISSSISTILKVIQEMDSNVSAAAAFQKMDGCLTNYPHLIEANGEAYTQCKEVLGLKLLLGNR